MNPQSVPPLQLLHTNVYLQDLIKGVHEAKTHIHIMTLVFTEDVYTEKLIDAIEQAAQRGVKVTIAADVFTFAEFGGYLSFFQRQAPLSRKASYTADRLRAAGATFTWLGKRFKLNPFGGVTHIKWSVIDGTTYCFGGVNLYEDGLKSVDYMFKSTHPSLAEEIITQHLAITQNPSMSYKGYQTNLEYGTLYIDSGKRGQSFIYNRLSKLAKEAVHVLAVTQYCPSGPLARLLAGKSDVYYNPPSHMRYPAKLLIQYGEIRTGLRSQYKRSSYLHAKFMIFTMPNERKVAITGSHNFSYSGVLFGTREVALETHDPKIIEQLEQFYRDRIA